MLPQRHQSAPGVQMLRGRDVDHRAGFGPVHDELQRSGGDPAQVVAQQGDVTLSGRAVIRASPGLVVEDLLNRVDMERSSRNTFRSQQRCPVDRSAGKRRAHRRSQHPERFARRRRESVRTGVDGCDLDRVRPPVVIERTVVPTRRMHAGVEGLQREARNVARHRNGRPCSSATTAPRTVRAEPAIPDQRLEHHRAGAQGVGRWHGHPPRGGGTEVSTGDGDHVRPRPQVGCQVDDVVVRRSRVRAHRAPGDLGAVDHQDVATVDPDPCGCRGGDCVELDDRAEQRHRVDRIGLHRTGRRLRRGSSASRTRSIWRARCW